MAINESRFYLDGHLSIVKKLENQMNNEQNSRMHPRVGSWSADRRVVVYMNGVVSCGCVGVSGSDLAQRKALRLFV